MSIATPLTRYSPEDLLNMPDGNRFELVEGQLVEINVSTWSSFVAGKIFSRLDQFNEAHKLGWVFPEGTSYQIFPADPEQVRRADASFIRAARLSVAMANSSGHNPVAPDLAVEVVSPRDLVYDVDDKVQDYLSAGVPLVWVINPQARIVQVHRPQATGTILHENDELEGGEVLPGFRCRVGDLFAPPSGISV